MTEEDKIDFTIQVKKRNSESAITDSIELKDMAKCHKECMGGKICLQYGKAQVTEALCERCNTSAHVDHSGFRTAIARTAFKNETSTFIGYNYPPYDTHNPDGEYPKPVFNVKVEQID